MLDFVPYYAIYGGVITKNGTSDADIDETILIYHTGALRGTKHWAVDCKCTIEEGSAGSLSFSIYPGNSFYKVVKPLSSFVWIEHNGAIIFMGRVRSITTDMDCKREIVCESALAFLGDVYCPIYGEANFIPNDEGLIQYIRSLIGSYNYHMNKYDAKEIGYTNDSLHIENSIDQFIVSEVNIPLWYRTYLELISEIRDAYGGYVYLTYFFKPNRKLPGVILNWKQYPKSGDEYVSQTLTYGVNLINSSIDVVTDTYANTVAAFGKSISISESDRNSHIIWDDTNSDTSGWDTKDIYPPWDQYTSEDNSYVSVTPNDNGAFTLYKSIPFRFASRPAYIGHIDTSGPNILGGAQVTDKNPPEGKIITIKQWSDVNTSKTVKSLGLAYANACKNIPTTYKASGFDRSTLNPSISPWNFMDVVLLQIPDPDSFDDIDSKFKLIDVKVCLVRMELDLVDPTQNRYEFSNRANDSLTNVLSRITTR